MNNGLKLFLSMALVVGTTGSLLSGCAPLAAGGAVTGAVITNDRRTAGTVLEDQNIENKAKNILTADGEVSAQAHINVTSFNLKVLVTGEAPTEEMKRRVAEYVSRIAKVQHVYDEIRVAAPSGSSSRANDTLLTTKVKTKLISIRDVSALDIKVVTENGVVYLMGLLDQATGDAVAEAVASIGGISKVVKLFESGSSALR